MVETVRSARSEVSTEAVRAGALARANGLVRVALVLLAAGCLSIAMPLRAADTSEAVDLYAVDAPLASALEHLAGLGGREVRVSDDIRDRLGGRLAGRADELIELLADTHDLDVYRDADTVWFDREGRRVVDFVRLDPERIELALEALSRPPGVGGAALRDASGRGIVLSGTRRYVETSLQRVRRASGSGPVAVEPDVSPGASSGGGAEGAAAELVSPASAVREDAAGALESMPVAARLALGEPRTEEVLGARIVLVSSRAPRAIVLADGRRLAPGDALPNGHRLAAIERERIVAVREGDLTIVSMP